MGSSTTALPLPIWTNTPPLSTVSNELMPGAIVTVAEQAGLYEVVSKGRRDDWVLRALNAERQPLVEVAPVAMRGLEVPIYHCFVALDPVEIVALVSGDDYDVTTENDPDVAAPLFQAVHALGLIEFSRVAMAAGFELIELTNGHDVWAGEIQQLIDMCQRSTAVQS